MLTLPKGTSRKWAMRFLFEELADALKKGGCKLTGVDPKKVLYISLIRNTRELTSRRMVGWPQGEVNRRRSISARQNRRSMHYEGAPCFTRMRVMSGMIEVCPAAKEAEERIGK
jgi:hypothetical protein